LIFRMLSSHPEERPAQAREVEAELAEICMTASLTGLSRAAPMTDSQASGTRLVTTLVALGVATGDERVREIERLREQGADALPPSVDSIVAPLGAQRAHGDEASRALELGQQLCEKGARVGVATGRMRVDMIRSAGQVVDRAAALAREAGSGRLLADGTTTEL